MDWIDINHLYEAPMYYIEYSLSGTVALNFWELAQDDWDGAFDAYLDFLAAPVDLNLEESVEAAGLKSIFDEENMRVLGDELKAYLAA
ncbi:MAG: hypothetical protein PHD67_09585 [Oscillospiraceae bacterium]|nr:hypothetical protein [Oscillospiraceae bacterium]